MIPTTTPEIEQYLSEDLQIVGFLGCDGVGTTTHANHAVDVLESGGLETHKEWIRFEHRLSLPVLALARLLGLNEIHEGQEGHTVRAHTFEGSKTITKLYMNTLVFDQRLMVQKKFESVPNGTDVLVCDRFIIDALVNLAVSTKQRSILNEKVAQAFWDLVPSRALLIGLQCDPETIASRRPDVAVDPFLNLRTEMYEELFDSDRINVVNTSQPIETAKNEVNELLETNL